MLSHYSPVKDTLAGEPLEIYPFLGSYLLAEAVDAEGADLIIHGHAHAGTEKGVTPGGIRVRNVALPVLGARTVYCLCMDRTALRRRRSGAASRDMKKRAGGVPGPRGFVRGDCVHGARLVRTSA